MFKITLYSTHAPTGHIINTIDHFDMVVNDQTVTLYVEDTPVDTLNNQLHQCILDRVILGTGSHEYGDRVVQLYHNDYYPMEHFCHVTGDIFTVSSLTEDPEVNDVVTLSPTGQVIIKGTYAIYESHNSGPRGSDDIEPFDGLYIDEIGEILKVVDFTTSRLGHTTVYGSRLDVHSFTLVLDTLYPDELLESRLDEFLGQLITAFWNHFPYPAISVSVRAPDSQTLVQSAVMRGVAESFVEDALLIK